VKSCRYRFAFRGLVVEERRRQGRADREVALPRLDGDPGPAHLHLDAAEAPVPQLVAGSVLEEVVGGEVFLGDAEGAGDVVGVAHQEAPGLAGESELILTVRDTVSGRTLEVREPFRVE
jgi:hypothetical protein